MKKSVITSLSAAAIVGGLSVPALAQTCLKTPTCADLGYTKSAADCTGKTILKCPLDNTKVYCPGFEESLRTYKVGDTYVDSNGIGIGTVVQVDSTGRHGILVSSGGMGDGSTATTSCAARAAGGLNWSLATGYNACRIDNGASCCGCSLRSSSGFGYCSGLSWSDSNLNNCDTRNLGFYCEAPF